MAEKLEGNAFLQEMNQVTKNGKCFKSLSDSTVAQAIVNEEFMNYCANCENKLEKYEHQKLTPHEANGPGFNELHVSLRDEILFNLNFLWETFSFARLKHGVCPSILNFVLAICKHDGCLFRILKSCLNSHDHFIAFQSYNVCCQVYKISPILVIYVWVDELFVMLLSDHNKSIGPWLQVYTAELIKSLVIDLGSDEIWQNFPKTLHSVCGCSLDEKCGYEICPNDIKSFLYCHWLNLTNHSIAEILNGDICGFSFNPVLQVLTTLLSCGNIFIEIFGSSLADQKLPVMNIDMGIFDKMHNVNMAWPIGEISLLQNDCQLCVNAQASCTHNFKLKSFKKVLMQLVEINLEKCSLSFNQTVFKFLNNVVDVFSDHCFSATKTNLALQICSILVKHSSKLLKYIPQVTGKAHFGGQVTCAEPSQNCDQQFDEVSLRKVLLLVLRSVLAMLQQHNDPSNVTQWQDIKTAIESWLSFVTELSQSGFQSFATWLIQLFAGQDDELVCLLFSLLQLYQGLFSIKSLQPSSLWTGDFCDSINPHVFFMKFLTSISYDHSLILDFLISNETNFLLYFHNYLRHLANDWHGFIETAEKRQDLSEEIGPHISKRWSCSIVKLASNDAGYNYVGGDGIFCNNAEKEFDNGEKEFDNGGANSNTKAGDDFDTGCDTGIGGDVGDCDNDRDYGNGFENSCGHHCEHVREGDTNASSEDDNVDGICGRFESSSDHCCDGVGNCDSSETFLTGLDSCSCIMNGSVIDDRVKGVTSEKDNAGGFQQTAADSGETTDIMIGLSSNKHLQQILTCIIRLRYSIERMSSKGLFPYPATALIKIIKYIETLYEGEMVT